MPTTKDKNTSHRHAKSKAGTGRKWGLGLPNTILSKWLCGFAVAIVLFLPASSPQIVPEALKGLLSMQMTRVGKGGQSKKKKKKGGTSIGIRWKGPGLKRLISVKAAADTLISQQLSEDWLGSFCLLPTPWKLSHLKVHFLLLPRHPQTAASEMLDTFFF